MPSPQALLFYSLLLLSSNHLSYPTLSLSQISMEKKALLKLLVILLSLSYVVYAVAVPATRSSMTRKVDPTKLDHQAQEDLIMDLGSSEEQFEVKEGLEKGKMMTDIEDYRETGPNHRHDPKSPGKP